VKVGVGVEIERDRGSPLCYETGRDRVQVQRLYFALFAFDSLAIRT
jgi:hypothetical protein